VRPANPSSGNPSKKEAHDDPASLQQALQSKQQLLGAVMEASYDGICLISPEGTFLEMNGAFERITGLKRDVWLGRTIDDMRNTPGVTRNSAALQVLNGSYPATTLVSISGGELMLVTASPHFGEDGELMSIILNVRNITQLNYLKRQLERDRDDADDAVAPSIVQERLERAGFEDFVVKSPIMEGIVSTVLQIADFDLTVLIEGETGVGKGILASLIHRLSRRADKPFVEVNCGAIPESLVESELFGYEPGAFTGSARTGKKGYFEAADGGTIFLDEIGELPKESQAKLLKILDDRMLTRVGGTGKRRLDVRVIAATNRRLRDLVRHGQFRADLLYRLETIPLVVPPLRERKQDLKALIHSLLARYNQEFHTKKVLASEAVHRLMDDPLPGNARELKNLLVRLVLTCADDEIGLSHVRDVLDRPGEGGGTSAKTPEIPGDAPPTSMKKRIEEFERSILVEYSQQCRSTYEVAARLGINQSSVVRKMKKYGIPPPASH